MPAIYIHQDGRGVRENPDYFFNPATWLRVMDESACLSAKAASRWRKILSSPCVTKRQMRRFHHIWSIAFQDNKSAQPWERLGTKKETLTVAQLSSIFGNQSKEQ